MDNPSARRLRLWEAMESCRSGTDDLSTPLFAELAARLSADTELRVQFQRVQGADAAIRAAFADLPIPAGLADRVSHRLTEAGGGVGTSQSAQEVSDCLVAATVTDLGTTASDAPIPLQKQTGRFSRRHLLVGFAALSASAALLAVIYLESHLPRQDTPTSVLEEAMDFFSKDNQPPGKLVWQVAPPTELPLSRDIVPLEKIRWRPVENFLGGPAVAYDLPTIGGRATLYVVQRNVARLPSIPPPMPGLSTGGKSAAAWQAGNVLYVLVLEGDAGTYSRYLDQSHGPLT